MKTTTYTGRSTNGRRPRVFMGAAAALGAWMVVWALPAGAFSSTWTAEAAPTNIPPGTPALTSVSCPSAAVCYAVGSRNRIVGDGATNSGSKTVTSNTAKFVTADVGASISGSTIPGGATISAINSSTSVVISANANATATVVSLSITRAKAPILYSTNANGATPTWALQTSGAPGVDLTGISCPSTTACYAVGDSTFVATTNSGATWTTLTPLSSANQAPWSAISCPSTTTCYAVASGPYNPLSSPAETAILKTTDGFSTVTQQYITSGYTVPLKAISCPSTTECAIGGGGGNIFYGPPSSGTNWSVTTSTDLDFGGMSCTSTTVCYASVVDESGVNNVYVTTNFSATTAATWNGKGTTGTPLPNHSLYYLGAISCVAGTSQSTDTCYIVGDADKIMTSSDGGTTWVNQPSGESSGLLGINCVPSICQAVGRNPTFAAITHN